MAFDIGSVIAHVTADIAQFKSAMSEAQDIVAKVKKSFTGLGDQIVDFTKKTYLLGAAAATGFGAFLLSGAQMAGQLEAAEQGFVALLGSAEKARATMQRIKREAAATPFEIPGLTAGAQALTAITKDGDRAIDTLLDVGKAIATSGKGQAELDRVILNLQQIAATGKVTAMDIKQFQGAIPIFNDILKASGLTAESLQDSSNAAELLFGAFKKAGEDGGITSQGFISQAGTFNQLLSNMKDSITIFGSEMVKRIGVFDLLKRAMESITNFINSNQDNVIDFFQKLGAAINSFIDAVRTGDITALSEAVRSLIPDGARADQAVFFLGQIVNGLRALGNWISENRETVLRFITGLGIALGSLLVIGTITGLLTALISPLTLITLATATLYTAWTQNWGGIQEKTQAVMDYLQNLYAKHKDEITAVFEAIMNIVKIVAAVMLAAWESHGKQLIMVVEGAFNIVVGIVRLVLSTIAGIINTVMKAIQGDWKGAWNSLVTMGKTNMDALQQFFAGFVETVIGLIASIFPAFKDTFEKVWNYAKDISTKIRKAISEAFDVKKRNSPSILDRLNQIVDSAHGAFEEIAVPKFSAEIANGLAGFEPSVIGASGSNNITIDLSGAVISDEVGATRIAEMIGDSLINKLKQNIRF